MPFMASHVHTVLCAIIPKRTVKRRSERYTEYGQYGEASQSPYRTLFTKEDETPIVSQGSALPDESIL